MNLLHISIRAEDPRRVARFLAGLLGGQALPFPPFPDCWIAFAREDDGTAVEVYPATHALTPGPRQVQCVVGAAADRNPTFAHLAIGSSLERSEIRRLADREGWLARLCDRGPFQCVEVWLEGRLLVEVLDSAMLSDYRAGMTAANWAAMFDLTPERCQ